MSDATTSCSDLSEYEDEPSLVEVGDGKKHEKKKGQREEENQKEEDVKAQTGEANEEAEPETEKEATTIEVPTDTSTTIHGVFVASTVAQVIFSV